MDDVFEKGHENHKKGFSSTILMLLLLFFRHSFIYVHVSFSGRVNERDSLTASFFLFSLSRSLASFCNKKENEVFYKHVQFTLGNFFWNRNKY